MQTYHAAYYRGEDGWIVVSLLDFPGVHSQGKSLREARYMIKDALKLMAEAYLEEGRPLPKPRPRARDKDAIHQEKTALEFHARTLAKA